MMSRSHRSVVLASALFATIAAAEGRALAQCPTGLPPSIVASITSPEIRQAAAAMPPLDASLIAQNGGLDRMIQLTKAQIASDRTTMAEEQRNQTYLAQNSMGADKRAVDGRTILQMLDESIRLSEAYLQILECHARSGGAPGLRLGAGGTGTRSGARFPNASTSPGPVREGSQTWNVAPTDIASTGNTGAGAPAGHGASDIWTMTPDQRKAAVASHARTATAGAGADFSRALEDLSRKLRQDAMANATPEVAAFWAKQDALEANKQANLAAVSAGQARGLQDAKEDSLDEQMKMVSKVVRTWQPPRGYAGRARLDASAVQDPFAATESNSSGGGDAALRAALGTSGLAWDDKRRVSRVGSDATRLCAGRLQGGDYPVLPDGNLLDTPARITAFLASCGDPDTPITVIRSNGELEVRK